MKSPNTKYKNIPIANELHKKVKIITSKEGSPIITWVEETIRERLKREYGEEYDRH